MGISIEYACFCMKCVSVSGSVTLWVFSESVTFRVFCDQIIDQLLEVLRSKFDVETLE